MALCSYLIHTLIKQLLYFKIENRRGTNQKYLVNNKREDKSHWNDNMVKEFCENCNTTLKEVKCLMYFLKNTFLQSILISN